MGALIQDSTGYYYRVTNSGGWAGADPQGYYQGQYRWDNPYLLNNARIIYSQLCDAGWDSDSACAVIGNMAREARLNPAQTQDGYAINGTSGGFGLVMWTPQTKYRSWCQSTDHDVNSGYWQVYYIINRPTATEQAQFNEHDGLYNITWNDFITNARGYTVEQLTAVWLKCYERAGISALDLRIYYASNYAQEFYNYSPQPVDPSPSPFVPVLSKMPLWMMVNRRKFIL